MGAHGYVCVTRASAAGSAVTERHACGEETGEGQTGISDCFVLTFRQLLSWGRVTPVTGGREYARMAGNARGGRRRF